MKILKYLLIGFLLIVASVFLIALILPKEYKLSATQKLNAPIGLVNRNISDFSQWKRWIPMLGGKVSDKLILGDKYKGAGAKVSWKTKSRSGNVTINSIKPQHSMEAMVNVKGMKPIESYWTMKQQGEGTVLSSELNIKIPMPMNALMYFQQSDVEKMLGEALNKIGEISKQDYENGLQYGNVLVSFEIPKYRNLIGLKSFIPMNAIQSFFKKNRPMIVSRAKAADTEIGSTMLGLYYQWNSGKKTTDLACAFPLVNGEVPEGVESIVLPNALAISAKHDGSYYNMYKAHEALREAADDMGLNLIAPIVEEYLVGPNETKNEKEYKSKVYYLYH